MEKDKWFLYTLYGGYNYFSMLRLKSIHVIEKGPCENSTKTSVDTIGIVPQFTQPTIPGV